MKPVKPPRINGRVPVLSAQEAVNYIPDEATLCVLGAGGGILEATTLITALADKYKQTKRHVIYRLLVRQGLAIAPTVVLVLWRKKVW